MSKDAERLSRRLFANPYDRRAPLPYQEATYTDRLKQWAGVSATVHCLIEAGLVEPEQLNEYLNRMDSEEKDD